jgi:hypothetical protein
MVHIALNICIFNLSNSTKAKRLSHCVLTFALFSVLCAFPVPTEAKNANALLVKFYYSTELIDFK